MYELDQVFNGAPDLCFFINFRSGRRLIWEKVGRISEGYSAEVAAEMAAFANTDGGTIFIGVTDHGNPQGLSREAVARINQLISNAASQLVRSPLTVLTENVLLANGNLVIVLSVPKGLDKPYFDKNGVI